MRKSLRTVAVATTIAGVMWMSGTMRVEAAPGACASTPAAALLAVRQVAADSTLAEGHGYRVATLRWDPFLRLGWAVIQSCDHLERPSFMMRADVGQAGLAASSLSGAADRVRMDQVVAVVRAGDLVRLWRAESYAHIEMMATSEESGGVGARVRVRLVAVKDDEGQVGAPLYLAGIVRGPADVEMTQ